MGIDKRIKKMVALGDYIRENGEALQAAKVQARLHNSWFTPENIDHALHAISERMLSEEVLREWVSRYYFSGKVQKVGMILAGNIPLVGFHDLLCVYLSGHQALVKASSKDSELTLHLLEWLSEDAFIVVDRLAGMDAVIATGSNQSAKQFERYFKDYPRIIRRNRNAVAVLEGSEISEEDAVLLGKDIFTYFGLGCRNVSKVYIPIGFDKTSLMEHLHEHFKHLVLHSKFKNNYDYNHAIFLLNQEDFLASGAVLLRRNKEIVSRIGCLHYEEYKDRSMLQRELLSRADEIQCISGNIELGGVEVLPLGKCQEPEIDDYADGVDTMAFLARLGVN